MWSVRASFFDHLRASMAGERRPLVEKLAELFEDFSQVDDVFLDDPLSLRFAGLFARAKHQPVRRLAVILGFGKNGAFVGQRHPRSSLGLPIPQPGTIGRGLCHVILQPLLVAQLSSLAQIPSLERQRRRRSILPDGGA